MEGLVEEGSEVIEEDMEDDVGDAALIAAAQRVEHYEIAGYGCVRTYAEPSAKIQSREAAAEDARRRRSDRQAPTGLAEQINVEAENTEDEEAEDDDSESAGGERRQTGRP